MDLCVGKSFSNTFQLNNIKESFTSMFPRLDIEQSYHSLYSGNIKRTFTIFQAQR